MPDMLINITAPADSLCDFTYGFCWQQKTLSPGSTVPYQKDTGFSYKDLVESIKNKRDVRIIGDAGNRLACSMGVNLKHLGGTGESINTERMGCIYIDGNVGIEMGMGMTSGVIYVKGKVQEPVGNVVEVGYAGDYRKFRSITDIVCNGLKGDALLSGNSYNESTRTLILNDGIKRGTTGARCNSDVGIVIKGDVYNGTGVLMKKGIVRVSGDAGMNTGAHLDGGCVTVRGDAGEFAGAYMKNGTLVLMGEAKGYAGAGMSGGVIYSKREIKTAPPAEKLQMEQEDARKLMQIIGINNVEAMSFKKYGIQKQKFRTVRMRDGSVVVMPE